MEHSDIEHMAQGYPPAHIAKDSEEVIVWLATQLLATQEQRDALAAENAAVRASIPEERFIDILNENMDDVSLAEDIGYNTAVKEMRRDIETPATEAYLNSVRAEGVDKAIAHLHKKFEGTGHIGVPVMALESLAAKLRAGKDGE